MKTRIFREGDKGVALCEHCKGRVTTTYTRRDVPLSDGSDTVKDVMVGVCDNCDSVVMLPQQSTPRVRRVLERQRKPIEARVPSHLQDMLNLVVSELHQSEGFEQQIFRYYIHLWSEQGAPVTRIRKYRQDPLFSGKANTRLSLRIDDGDEVIDQIRNEVEEIRSKTELLKAIAFAAFDDVVEKPKSRAKTALEAIAAAH